MDMMRIEKEWRNHIRVVGKEIQLQLFIPVNY